MDTAERVKVAELALGLPEGPLPWWEVSASFEDGKSPDPPELYPAGVRAAVHTATVLTLRLQAGSRAGALERAEELLGASAGMAGTWTVRALTAAEVLEGL